MKKSFDVPVSHANGRGYIEVYASSLVFFDVFLTKFVVC